METYSYEVIPFFSGGYDCIVWQNGTDNENWCIGRDWFPTRVEAETYGKHATESFRMLTLA